MASAITFLYKRPTSGKEKKLPDTIKRVNILIFMPKEDKTKKKKSLFRQKKISTSLLGKAQRNIEIACSRGFTKKITARVQFFRMPTL